ncbi:MAG: heme A synthase [Dehalococcoidia bacterium]|nr:heme A synthase [Dehalococcoidia bacterium]MSQ16427.1 heme A synthase [Dehalococcoidia bacterium]
MRANVMSAERGQGLIQTLSLLAALATLVLVVVGGVVRVSGSGLGCPDWPLCHGRVLPPWELTAVIEYTHRFVASAVVSPLVLATAGLVWWTRRQEPWLVVTATLAVVLLAGQAILGGVTVLWELPPVTVAAHLALGQALLACLVVLAVAARRPSSAAAHEHTRSADASGEAPGLSPRLALAAAGVLYLLLLTGAFVTASGALAACPSWPLCDGTSVLGGPAGRLSHIHMLHRLAALLLGLFVLYVLHRGIRRPGSGATRLLSMTATGLFAAQVLAGALMIWLGFPVVLLALHLALASATWASVVALAALSLPRLHAAAASPAPQAGPAHA